MGRVAKREHADLGWLPCGDEAGDWLVQQVLDMKVHMDFWMESLGGKEGVVGSLLLAPRESGDGLDEFDGSVARIENKPPRSVIFLHDSLAISGGRP